MGRTSRSRCAVSVGSFGAIASVKAGACASASIKAVATGLSVGRLRAPPVPSRRLARDVEVQHGHHMTVVNIEAIPEKHDPRGRVLEDIAVSGRQENDVRPRVPTNTLYPYANDVNSTQTTLVWLNITEDEIAIRTRVRKVRRLLSQRSSGKGLNNGTHDTHCDRAVGQ